MTIRCTLAVRLALAAGLLGASALAADPVSPRRVEGYGRFDLVFFENRGQAPPDTRFQVLGRDVTASFGGSSVTFALHRPTPLGRARHRNGRVLAGRPESAALTLAAPTPESVALELVGARPDLAPEPAEPAATVYSVFTGPPEAWVVGAPSFSALTFRDAWPGIDATWSGKAGRLKYTYLVAPGADPSSIRMRWKGADAVEIDPDGRLLVHVGDRVLSDDAPVAWQEIGGSRVPVDVAFALDEGSRTVGFTVGEHDPGVELVVDPATFVYAGFLGSSVDDRGLGVAVDSLGAAYMTGEAPNLQNGYDAYVAKVNPAGTAFSYLALVGGTSYDAAYDIAVTPAFEAVITGAADSSTPSFPVVMGPDLTYNGAGDAFVAKLNATGTGLVYCGYIGGSALDFAEGVVLDAAGNVFLTGPTASSEATFPAVVGPDLTFNGRYDTFVAKMKAVPNAASPQDNFHWCGYIGGRGVDVGLTGGFVTDGHVAIDAAGAAYVSGMTKSTERSFPDGDGFGALPGFDRDHGGRFDGYVAKVLPSGTGLAYCTYVGGSKNDSCFGMGVDAAGNAYFTGDTASDQRTFPVTGGPDLTYNGGGSDAFVGKLNPSGTGLAYLGYLGGDDLEQGLGLVVRNGIAHAVGHTHSSDATFPEVGGPDLTYNGVSPDGDVWVARLKANPTSPVPENNYDFCGFIGGAAEDSSYWLDVDAAGFVYVVGDTASTQATFPDGDGLGPLTSPGAAHQGGFDAFIVKIAP